MGGRTKKIRLLHLELIAMGLLVLCYSQAHAQVFPQSSFPAPPQPRIETTWECSFFLLAIADSPGSYALGHLGELSQVASADFTCNRARIFYAIYQLLEPITGVNKLETKALTQYGKEIFALRKSPHWKYIPWDLRDKLSRALSKIVRFQVIRHTLVDTCFNHENKDKADSRLWPKHRYVWEDGGNPDKLREKQGAVIKKYLYDIDAFIPMQKYPLVTDEQLQRASSYFDLGYALQKKYKPYTYLHLRKNHPEFEDLITQQPEYYLNKTNHHLDQQYARLIIGMTYLKDKVYYYGLQHAFENMIVHQLNLSIDACTDQTNDACKGHASEELIYGILNTICPPGAPCRTMALRVYQGKVITHYQNLKSFGRWMFLDIQKHPAKYIYGYMGIKRHIDAQLAQINKLNIELGNRHGAVGDPFNPVASMYSADAFIQKVNHYWPQMQILFQQLKAKFPGNLLLTPALSGQDFSSKFVRNAQMRPALLNEQQAPGYPTYKLHHPTYVPSAQDRLFPPIAPEQIKFALEQARFTSMEEVNYLHALHGFFDPHNNYKTFFEEEVTHKVTMPEDEIINLRQTHYLAVHKAIINHPYAAEVLCPVLDREVQVQYGIEDSDKIQDNTILATFGLITLPAALIGEASVASLSALVAGVWALTKEWGKSKLTMAQYQILRRTLAANTDGVSIQAQQTLKQVQERLLASVSATIIAGVFSFTDGIYFLSTPLAKYAINQLKYGKNAKNLVLDMLTKHKRLQELSTYFNRNQWPDFVSGYFLRRWIKASAYDYKAIYNMIKNGAQREHFVQRFPYLFQAERNSFNRLLAKLWGKFTSWSGRSASEIWTFLTKPDYMQDLLHWGEVLGTKASYRLYFITKHFGRDYNTLKGLQRLCDILNMGIAKGHITAKEARRITDMIENERVIGQRFRWQVGANPKVVPFLDDHADEMLDTVLSGRSYTTQVQGLDAHMRTIDIEALHFLGDEAQAVRERIKDLLMNRKLVPSDYDRAKLLALIKKIPGYSRMNIEDAKALKRVLEFTDYETSFLGGVIQNTANRVLPPTLSPGSTMRKLSQLYKDDTLLHMFAAAKASYKQPPHILKQLLADQSNTFTRQYLKFQIRGHKLYTTGKQKHIDRVLRKINKKFDELTDVQKARLEKEAHEAALLRAKRHKNMMRGCYARNSSFEYKYSAHTFKQYQFALSIATMLGTYAVKNWDKEKDRYFINGIFLRLASATIGARLGNWSQLAKGSSFGKKVVMDYGATRTMGVVTWDIPYYQIYRFEISQILREAMDTAELDGTFVKRMRQLIETDPEIQDFLAPFSDISNITKVNAALEEEARSLNLLEDFKQHEDFEDRYDDFLELVIDAWYEESQGLLKTGHPLSDEIGTDLVFGTYSSVSAISRGALVYRMLCTGIYNNPRTLLLKVIALYSAERFARNRYYLWLHDDYLAKHMTFYEDKNRINKIKNELDQAQQDRSKDTEVMHLIENTTLPFPNP